MSNINDFVRPTSNTSRRDINKILEMIHDLVAAEPEDEGAQERIAHAAHLKIRTTTVTSGGATRVGSNFRDKENFSRRRKPPTVVNSYPLIHTSNNFSGVTFPVSDTKFGARVDWDGVGYITVGDDVILNITDKLTIAFWTRLVGFTGTARHIIMKGSSAPVPYLVRTFNSGNTLHFKFRVNGVDEIFSITYTPDVWTHWVVAWDNTSNLMEVWKDKVSQGTNATSGNLDTNALILGIAARNDGTQILANLDRLAHLTVLNAKVNQAWVDKHFDGLLDTSDGNDEIMTIDFCANEDPTPDELTDFCKSS